MQWEPKIGSTTKKIRSVKIHSYITHKYYNHYYIQLKTYAIVDLVKVKLY